jgi:hypothetical protein
MRKEDGADAMDLRCPPELRGTSSRSRRAEEEDPLVDSCPTVSTQVDSASAATGPTRGGARCRQTDEIFFLGTVAVAATEAVVLL